MSFGKNSSKQTQQSQQTSNSYLDPTILNDLQQNLYRTQKIANTPYQPYTGELVAPQNAIQQQANQGILGIAANNVGGSTLNDAIAKTSAAGNYQPLQVGSITPSQINRGSIGNVDTSGISASDIGKFLNPYTQNVVDATANDINMQGQRQINQNNADLTKLGAWRGTANAVNNALTNEATGRTLATTVANLRSQGYDQATATALANLQAQQAGQSANQNTDLSVAGQNANLAQTGAIANQAAQQANQGAGLTAAAQQLSAGSSLANMSAQQLAQALGIQQAVAGVGSAAQQTQQQLDTANLQQYTNAQNWPLLLQQLLNQSLGLAGNPVLTSSQGTSSGTGSSSGFNFGLGGNK